MFLDYLLLFYRQGSVIATVETAFPSAATSYPEVTQTIVNNIKVLAELNLSLDSQSLCE